MSPAVIKSLADRLFQSFQDAGAVPVETPALQSAEVLLDLYGEDIRGRAYVTDDPVEGELMLRPDFTVPVAQMHMAGGAEPARYTYNGPIWRKQDPELGRAKEYLQVGYELFDRTDPAAADAEVFALFNDLLSNDDLRVATGDVGLLVAAIDGLTTTDRRKERLKRQVWRPDRFRHLLDWYSGKAPNLASRTTLLDAVATKGLDAVMALGQPSLGLRSDSEIAARVASLADDAEVAPIPAQEVAVLDNILALNDDCAAVLEQLRACQAGLAGFSGAVDQLETRLDAMAAKSVDVARLPFETSFGLTSMEYYDGFVFGFFKDTRTVASGGRYDALTQVLGQGRSIPAVGGVIRPETLADIRGDAS